VWKLRHLGRHEVRTMSAPGASPTCCSNLAPKMIPEQMRNRHVMRFVMWLGANVPSGGETGLQHKEPLCRRRFGSSLLLQGLLH
jgi:hypothetical protein